MGGVDSASQKVHVRPSSAASGDTFSSTAVLLCVGDDTACYHMYTLPRQNYTDSDDEALYNNFDNSSRP